MCMSNITYELVKDNWSRSAGICGGVIVQQV